MQTFSDSKAIGRPFHGARVRSNARAVAVAGIWRERLFACLALVLLVVAWDAAMRMDERLGAWGAGLGQESLAEDVLQSVSLPR
jgi:hypothetical protein